MTYVELQVTTHFSFLRGASSCEELFAQAALLGLPALGVVDRNSLAGAKPESGCLERVTGVEIERHFSPLAPLPTSHDEHALALCHRHVTPEKSA